MPIFNPRTSWLMAAPLVMLTLLGAGCGGLAHTIDTETNTVNIQNENGGSFSGGEGAQIPANFPTDFPKYPGAKTFLAYTENGGKSSSLVQDTTDSFSQVQTRIEQELQSKGFTKENVISDPSLIILTFSKGTIRYQINIMKDGEKTRIQSVRVEE